MESLVKRILARMRAAPEEVYFPSDFFDLGEEARVNKALSRMAQSGQIERFARGMYAVYIESRFGKVLPYTGALVSSYAKRKRVVITEIGAAAVNILGFSTQNVLREIYLTTGKPSVWKFGAYTVEFRTGSTIDMFFGNTLHGKLIRAWNCMGEKESFDALPLLYTEIAKQINWDAIICSSGVLPIWMNELAKKGKLYEWT